MPTRSAAVEPIRAGDALQIGRELVSFGRNVIAKKAPPFTLQHRFFVNDPWELIAEGIHRALPAGRTRDIAHSFRRQAEDYFRAATVGRELAVRPVLLYYAFLNLSKAYAVADGNTTLASAAFHGISFKHKPRAIPGSLIEFPSRSPAVFRELLQHLDGNLTPVSSSLRLGHVLPQILPGHRLWCYATGRKERFLSVERSQLLHLPSKKQVWLNLYLNPSDLDRLEISDKVALSQTDLLGDFEIARGVSYPALVCFQQRTPTIYSVDPAEALIEIVRKARNRIWETVKVESPYRKPYLYCCPSRERRARLPQILSIYLLMFCLGSVTRYSPLYFDDLFESKYGPLFDTFISESPMQFLYLMASEILGQEVSKPAII
jgi:hypothetical protein